MEKIGYITLLEAEDYISSHFLSSDEERVRWESLKEEDKKVLLNQSLDDIENLNFVGIKTDSKQALQFPRYPMSEIPQEIKAAQIAGAVARLGSDTSYQSQSNGITSERLGNASYSYSTSNNAAITHGIRKESYKLLKKYIKQVFRFS